MGWLLVMAFFLLMAVAGGLDLVHQRRAAKIVLRVAVGLLVAIGLWLLVGAAQVLLD